MKNDFFSNNTARVGQKDIVFERRNVLDRFYIYIPRSFKEDHNIVSNYCYMFSVDKSPLGITLKYMPITDPVERQKLVANYLGREASTTGVDICGGNVVYGESKTESAFASIYSLRFVINMEDGVLTGCFNSALAYAQDWREVVLQLLQNVEPQSDD